MQSGMVKPNLILLFDDSGSMGWSYTGDDVFYLSDRVGYRTSLCNGQYYNPDIRYRVPTKWDGTSYSTPAFTDAPGDGFAGTTGRDLSSGYAAFGSADCPNCAKDNLDNKNTAAYYYRFIGSASVAAGLRSMRTSGNSSQDACWYSRRDGALSKVWQQVTVDGKSGPAGNADERQNFAIWYSFWRTRMLAMKSAISIAFQSIDDQLRVGFSTINEISADSNKAGFLAIADFSGDQRTSFFKKLQAQVPGSGTPLRAAVSKAGRLYGAKLTGADGKIVDPMQYACQRNFALIATDGEWNTSNESNTYGPLNLAGKSVDNADSTLPAPKSGRLKGVNGGDGPAETLADVAAWYRNNDLRPGTTAPGLEDLVPEDNGRLGPQTMRSFAIGLGLNGTLAYTPDYPDGTSPDFAAISAGTKSWPDPTTDSAAKVDDLWHAAVNGDGRYFDILDMDELQRALKQALDTIRALPGANAGVAFNDASAQSAQVVYATSYQSIQWSGDLTARPFDSASGSAGAPLWSAAKQLDQRIAAGRARNINLFDGTRSNKLKPFTTANLSSAESTQLTVCGNGVTLSQCALLSSAQQSDLNANMVAWLQGQKVGGDLFRQRASAMGDMVGSRPVVVGAPVAAWADPGYRAFAAANINRAPTVYVGANDGMLHAFAADTGEERWAYIPPAVLPNLPKLADRAYASRHQYNVDGTVAVADICIASSCSVASSWKTVLVGGFNAGGRGYYALDITDPNAPAALWNFNSDAGLGSSFGNPLFMLQKDGSWAVAFAAGYNNADGQGRLYVLDAWSGTVKKMIPTGVGSKSQQAGLSRLAAGSSIGVVYGGDLLGNLWRFDTDPQLPAAASARRVATFIGPDGSTPQAITAAPLVVRANVGGVNRNLIVVGTGRLLGESDKAITAVQSLYVLDEGSPALSPDNPRGKLTARQTTTDTSVNPPVRTIDTRSPVDWSTRAGWYLDLPAGERINLDPALNGTLLSFVGNVPPPANDPCRRGSAWFYGLELTSGAPQAPSVGSGITWIGTGMLVGATPRRPAGATAMLTVDETGQQKSLGNWTFSGTSVTLQAKRISWRELVN